LQEAETFKEFKEICSIRERSLQKAETFKEFENSHKPVKVCCRGQKDLKNS
jgi:hypothetical protein